MVCFFYPHDAS